MSAEILRELARAKVTFQLRAIEAVIRGPALAAGTRSDETPSAAQSEGCQSGPQGQCPNPIGEQLND